MFVLVTYDVPADRTHVYRKLLRRHLDHIQQSVFYGDVTEGQFVDIEAEIDDRLGSEDSVYLFTADVASNVDCTVKGVAEDPDDQFI
jgi:CRISPR-associated protein Cas2